MAMVEDERRTIRDEMHGYHSTCSMLYSAPEGGASGYVHKPKTLEERSELANATMIGLLPVPDGPPPVFAGTAELVAERQRTDGPATPKTITDAQRFTAALEGEWKNDHGLCSCWARGINVSKAFVWEVAIRSIPSVTLTPASKRKAFTIFDRMIGSADEVRHARSSPTGARRHYGSRGRRSQNTRCRVMSRVRERPRHRAAVRKDRDRVHRGCGIDSVAVQEIVALRLADRGLDGVGTRHLGEASRG